MTIKNFGQMDKRFFRGARPRKKHLDQLAAAGIKTIIDLRENVNYREKTHVETIGMRYVSIPMSDTKYPSSKQVQDFLSTVEDPSTGSFFVHCAGGRHRTGVIGAVYRAKYFGWKYERVYSEMKAYDFYARWGHAPLKRFVQDYIGRLSC